MRTTILRLNDHVAIVRQHLRPLVIDHGFLYERAAVWQHDERKWSVALRHRQECGNLAPVARIVADVAQVGKILALYQRLFAANRFEFPVLKQVVGARIMRPGVIHCHRFAVARAAVDIDIV